MASSLAAAQVKPDELAVDPLFVALTRPAMAYGVTYGALLVNVVLTLEAFLLTRNLLALLVCLPLHGLAWMLCAVEPRFLELMGAWGRTRVSGLAVIAAWGAQPYGALPVDLPREGSGCRAVRSRRGGVASRMLPRIRDARAAEAATVRGSLAR